MARNAPVALYPFDARCSPSGQLPLTRITPDGRPRRTHGVHSGGGSKHQVMGWGAPSGVRSVDEMESPVTADRRTAGRQSPHRRSPSPLRSARRMLVLTFAISWGSWLAAALVGGGLERPLVLGLWLVGGCGPSLAAGILALTRRRDADRQHPAFGSGVNWAAMGRWGTAALLIGTLTTAASVLFGPVGSWTTASAVLGAAGGLVPLLAVGLLAGPLSEEFGWRGVLQPALRTRFSPAVSSLMVGAVWALWHIPLFMIPGTAQAEMGAPFGIAELCFLLSTIALAPIFFLLTERLRGGVPAAILLHLAVNTGLTLFPPTARSWPVLMALCTLISAAILVAVRSARSPDPR